MGNTKTVLFAILIAILLAILIIWSADCLAHGWNNATVRCSDDPNCDPSDESTWSRENTGWYDDPEGHDPYVKHFHQGVTEETGPQGSTNVSCDIAPGTPINADNPSDAEAIARAYFHHCGVSTGAGQDFDGQDYATIIEPPPPPEPEPDTTLTPTTTSTSRPKSSTTSTPQSSSTTPTTRRQSTTPSATTTTTIEESLGNAQDTIPEDLEVPEPEPELEVVLPCERELVPFGFWNRYSIHTVPVMFEDVETVADLWERYDFIGKRDGAMHLNVDDTWLKYAGEGDVGEIVLTPHMAIIIENNGMNNFKHLIGCRVPNQGSVIIKRGVSMIGFPQVPPGYNVPSDFLSDIVCTILVAHKGELKSIGRPGDSGDEPLRDGQGLIMIAIEETAISLETPAAPMAQRATILTTTWGAMKQ